MVDGLEGGIVGVGVAADDVDGFAVAVGGLAMIAAGFAHHAEAVVAVMDIGEAREQVPGGLFGGIEIAGLDHVNHGVGRLGQFVAFILFLEIAGQRRPARRHRGRLSGTCGSGGSVVNMPSGTAGQVIKKAAVTGAVGGVAVAAAGGDEAAVRDAFLRSGSAVLVQGASARLQAYSPGAGDALQTVQCISGRSVDCLSSTNYTKDLKGRILYDENNQPRIDTTILDPKQRIGEWTAIDPDSIQGKEAAIKTEVSKLPQTQVIPIANNQWAATWTLGKDKTLPENVPAVVLTYVGQQPPFYSTVAYGSLPKK